MQATRRVTAFASLCMLFGIESSGRAEASFRTFGIDITASAVSADGSVLAGTFKVGNAYHAFRWTQVDGFTDIGDLPGGLEDALPTCISADGSVIAGNSYSTASGGSEEGFRWTQATGMVGIGDLPGGDFRSVVNGISADGSIIVGASYSAASSVSGQNYEAFRWTEAGILALGTLTGAPSGASSASGISGDGSIVVGSSENANGEYQTVTWTSEAGIQPLDLSTWTGQNQGNGAKAISSDGRVIVGTIGANFGPATYRWTQDDAIRIPDLPGGNEGNDVADVSGDGSVIVGDANWLTASNNDFPTEVYYWREGVGTVSLRDYLIANGVTGLDDWVLFGANAVSTDGHTILGYGINPDGHGEGFVATVPEPGTTVLATMACLFTVVFVMHKHRYTCLRSRSQRFC